MVRYSTYGMVVGGVKVKVFSAKSFEKTTFQPDLKTNCLFVILLIRFKSGKLIAPRS